MILRWIKKLIMALRSPISIKPFHADFGLWLTTDAANPDTSAVMALGETDGTLKVSNYGTAGATLTAVEVETSGEQKVTTYGKASSTITAVELESSGEQKNVIHGKDSGSNIDPLRTNASQQLQVEVVDSEGTKARKRLGGTADASTEVVLYTVPSGKVTEITLIVISNRSSAARTFDLGHSVGGGAIANEDYIAHTTALAANTTIEAAKEGLFMAATDELRALTEDTVPAGASDVTINVYGIEYTA